MIMKSSYKNSLDYSDIFKTICFINNPKQIVEIGILDGYSLKAMAETLPWSNIQAFDIFEDFNGNGSKRDIVEKFKDYNNVSIEYGNFYKINFPHNTIDLLHIDIANNGDVYEFVFENYIKYMKSGGIILLEGGAKERDQVEWMEKYNKTKIQPIINKYQDQYSIYTLDKFPSLTIVKIP